MSKKKYDTNPLDHDVKKDADRTMAAVDEDSATAELPTPQIGNQPGNTNEAETNALNSQQPFPRATSGSGLNQTTRAANPMTNADLHTPGTGPAYLPPGNNPAPGYYPSQSAGVPPYQPGYQANPRPGGYNPQYPPPYAPVSPAGYPRAPYRPQNRGLGIDPNIEGGLCYIPYLGWIMSILVMIKEPKTNMFARFHAFQSLILHGGMLLLSFIFGILITALTPIHYAGIPFVVINSMIKLIAFFGFIFLAIMSFQMKTIKIPYVSDLVEKYNV